MTYSLLCCPHPLTLGSTAAGLGEARIRDLNDEINKLLREKGHWERQIKALGGPDYTLNAPRLFDSADVLELPGSGGYKYFGAAKDLPGVKDLFSNAAAPERARRGRGQIAKGITPDYYGYRDEDDGVLVAAEASAERQLVTDAVEQWREGRAAAKRARVQAAPDSGAPGAGGLDSDSEGGDIDEASLAEEVSALSSAAFKAHVPLPQQAEIEGALLARKKALLLSKLAAQGAGAS